MVGRGGHFTPDEVRASAHTTDAAGHIPPTTLLMVENTHNRGGGKVMTPAALAQVADAAHGAGLRVHIDGARLFNAACATGAPVSAFGQAADSVSICLSKGLGAPVGSVLCGSEAFIRRAHRYRKMLGGGMRQAGILAAAGLHALEHHVADLAADHARAQAFAESLAAHRCVALDPASVQSNIVIFRVAGRAPADVCAALAPGCACCPSAPTPSARCSTATWTTPIWRAPWSASTRCWAGEDPPPRRAAGRLRRGSGPPGRAPGR
ncbi:MAG: beta-eliminating lyase-related protein [bacterium]